MSRTRTLSIAGLLMIAMSASVGAQSDLFSSVQGAAETALCTLGPNDAGSGSDAGDEPGNATPLPDGTSDACLHFNDWFDVYAFELAAGDGATVLVEPARETYMSIDLSGCEGGSFFSWDSTEVGEPIQVGAHALEDTIACVQVYGEGPYTITLDRTPLVCDDGDPHDQLEMYDAAWGCLDLVDDYDDHRTHVSAGERVTVLLYPWSECWCGDVRYYVRGPGLGLINGIATVGEPPEPVSFVASEDGYLWVSLYHNGGGLEYSLQVYRGPLMDLAVTEIVEERHPIRTEVASVPNPAADVRTLNVRVDNVGDAAGAPSYVSLEVRPTKCLAERLVNEPLCLGPLMRQYFTEDEPPSIAPGGYHVFSFEWDTLGRAGDYVVTAYVSPWVPEYTYANNVHSTETYVIVGGLGNV